MLDSPFEFPTHTHNFFLFFTKKLVLNVGILIYDLIKFGKAKSINTYFKAKIILPTRNKFRTLNILLAKLLSITFLLWYFDCYRFIRGSYPNNSDPLFKMWWIRIPAVQNTHMRVRKHTLIHLEIGGFFFYLFLCFGFLYFRSSF